MSPEEKAALYNEMAKINGFMTKQFFAYKFNRIPTETFNQNKQKKKKRETKKRR